MADVYVGIDVFGRGKGLMYTEGRGVADGVGLIAEAGLSVALFAPGWVMECGPARGLEPDAAAVEDAAFWASLGLDRIKG